MASCELRDRLRCPRTGITSLLLGTSRCGSAPNWVLFDVELGVRELRRVSRYCDLAALVSTALLTRPVISVWRIGTLCDARRSVVSCFSSCTVIPVFGSPDGAAGVVLALAAAALIFGVAGRPKPSCGPTAGDRGVPGPPDCWMRFCVSRLRSCEDETTPN